MTKSKSKDNAAVELATAENTISLSSAAMKETALSYYRTENGWAVVKIKFDPKTGTCASPELVADCSSKYEAIDTFKIAAVNALMNRDQ